MRVKVKICGLYRMEDIFMINEIFKENVIDYVGFVVNIPKSHRNVSVSQVHEFRKKLNAQVKTVGVFVDEPLESVADVAFSLDVIQLHGSESVEYLGKLRKQCPDKEVWKAFSVKTTEEVENALEFPSDKVLLDYGKGEGKTFDWTILKEVKKPFILAGGITPENVKKAILEVSPEIVDLSSGVETDKIKDEIKIKKLLEEMRN